MIKAEDDRYELDINLKRMKKSLEILDQIVDNLTEMPTADVSGLLRKVLGLGIMQYFYRNVSKEFKDEFEYHMKKNPLETCKVYRERLKGYIGELIDIRNNHIKPWKDISSKNSVKALDFKGHEFKRVEKTKMKGNVFL